MSEQEGIDQSTKDLVWKWLMDMGYTVERNSFPGLSWAIKGTAEAAPGVAIGVAEKIGQTDRIYVQYALQIAGVYREELARLPDSERREFVWDIRFRLIGMDADFQGADDPLIAVNFLEIIYKEALNRTTFRTAIRQIVKSYIALDWMLQRKFSQALPGGEALPKDLVN